MRLDAGEGDLGRPVRRFLAGAPIEGTRALAELVLATPDADVWYVQAQIILLCADSHRAPLADAQIVDLLAKFRERVAVFPMGSTAASLMVIDALRRSQRVTEAAALTDEMIAFARAHDERIFETELVRLRGDLHDDPASYREAVSLAEASNAVTLAIRARASLER